ncbi:hypothetical protein N39L_53180 [Limnospira platensis NIES-39]|uniref:Uncharacterized protein n=2 Tax=Cyanophyceae TaxID=3028117 RepID=A0A5M3T4X1_LIMPL|nr:hypothetical protein N39L_53180 [Arthrospira platensis NIES-39]GCE92398.1 hypothetical protein NIES46_04380 [Arthrospira platensis NIES-46]GCE92846.1 hypothetical protein NIES46_08890 [Arthrospira platensis NIES-46]
MRSPATWQEYQALCEQRGEGSIPRLKYRSGFAKVDVAFT